MTLDGFLTILALFAAIYAVLSPVQRMRVSLSWRAQALVAVPAFGLILLFALFDVTPPGCPSALGAYCDRLILSEAEPGSARKFAFLVGLVWLALAVLIHRRYQPSLGSVPALSRLATTMLDEEQYSDALKLLEPRLPLLAKAARRKWVRQRLHDWLEEFGPTPPDSFARFACKPSDRKYCGENWPAWLARPAQWLAKVVPAYDRAEHEASDLFQLLFNSPTLLTYMVERRPYFALSLMRQDVFGAADFCELFLTKLMSNPGSALYQELATNQMSDGPVGYHLPTRNRILHYLFADARNAERLSAWKPVGDYVERLLDGDEGADYRDWLNGSPDWFERDQYRDPSFMGMFFFDIMVTSAARQGAGYHMWLYYLQHFAERLEAAYDSNGEGIDSTAEFPTRAARLLYELVQTLKGWVDLFARLPEDSPHREFPEHPDRIGTIPHAAARALGRVLACVVRSPRVDRGVMQTLHDVIIRQIRNFHNDSSTLSQMRAFLIDALLRGDGHSIGREYWLRLAALWGGTDYMLRHEVEDYRQALEARLGQSIVD